MNALAGNYLLSLGGEGLQSGFHFCLNLLLIRFLSPYDYGVFAIVFVLGGIALTYGNALVSLPANVHIARTHSARAANFNDVAFGSVALAIAIAAMLVVSGGLLAAIGNPGEAWAGGLFVGLWMLRNHVRYAIFARQQMPTAALADFSYALAGAALLGLLLWRHPESVRAATVLIVLAAANVAGIAVALAASGRALRISFGRSVRRRYRSIRSEVAWSLVWVTTWNVQGQGLMFLVATTVGPAAYAPIAAGLVLVGPLRTAVGALVNVVRPAFASALAEQRPAMVRRTLFAGVLLAVAGCLAFGIVIRVAWPLLDEWLYGAKFAGASMPLIVSLAWINALAYLSYVVPLTLVQAARAFKAVALSTTLGGLVGISLVALLLHLASVAWSLAGAAAGEGAALVYIWVVAIGVLRGLSARDAPSAPSTKDAASYAPRMPEWHV